ncbi:MAG: WYL domain-containing protein [Sulfurovaceae bacterium]|nr:WYL domain-containing protein [Sulfurovaceae bacterium]
MAYKHDYDTILTRLTIILSRLNAGEMLSVKELATEFNVSGRTIQRDLNERLTSFPIYQDKKLWRMQDGHRLEKSVSVEDTIVLDIMQKLIESAGHSFSAKAGKLLGKIKNDTFNPFFAKLGMEDIGDKLPEVQQLENAIKKQMQIKCHYAMDDGSKELDLKPLKIANYDGFWYLVALDARNDKLKKYYLKNIDRISLTPNHFDRTQKLDRLLENSLAIWFEDDVEPYRVILSISKDTAKYFKRKPISPSQRIESLHEDGSMDVSVEITHDMEIIPFVKHWIPYIRVIEPLSIAEAINEDVKAYLELL